MCNGLGGWSAVQKARENKVSGDALGVVQQQRGEFFIGLKTQKASDYRGGASDVMVPLETS